MYNFILITSLLLFGIFFGIIISKYSLYCEIKYEMTEKNNTSLKRTIIITIITTILMIIDFLMFKDELAKTLILAVFSIVMVYMIVIDFETMYILDRTHLFIVILAGIGMIFKFPLWNEGLLGLLVGGGIFLLIALIANPIARRKYGDDVQALGYGDVKLMAACGLFIGYKLIILSIVIGSIVGVITQLIIKTIKKDEEVNFAFGPYLAIGILISIYFGNSLIDLYLSIIGV